MFRTDVRRFVIFNVHLGVFRKTVHRGLWVARRQNHINSLPYLNINEVVESMVCAPKLGRDVVYLKRLASAGARRLKGLQHYGSRIVAAQLNLHLHLSVLTYRDSFCSKGITEM